MSSSFSLNDDVPYDKEKSKEYIYRMENERFKAFKEQDTEKGHFDVTFEIEGKMLHANKVFLTTISERFDAWLSDRWSTKDKPVKVEDSSYDNFYQFLCFIYSGFCKINRGNAFQLTDMAESYGVVCFKEFCDGALSKMKINVEDIEEMYEHADLYTLPKLMDSVKSYIVSPYNGGSVYRDKNFLAFKKPFVQYLSTFPRDPDYLIREHYSFVSQISSKCRKESEFFESVYKWAERQVQNKAPLGDNAFDLQEAVKAELKTIIPNPEFCDMSYEFLLNFAVEKGFFLSAAEFGKFFVKYRDAKRYVNEDTLFKSVYELAEKQAFQKQKMSSDPDNFNVAETIKDYLAQIIPDVKFYQMDKQFLMDFILENGFILSPTDLSKFYQHCIGSASGRFKQIYELAEKQGLKKQMIASDPDNFNLVETIKTDMAKVIPLTNFCHTDKEFLMNFFLENGFILSREYLSKFYERGPDILEEKRFEIVYELAEKQAVQKQKISADPDNFDLLDSIKADLVQTIPIIKFYKMDKQFLMDFVLEKGFTLSPINLSNFHMLCSGTESERFKQVYELAEKQAIQKQKMSSDPDNFNIAETIKTDISNVKFYLMDKKFLNDFNFPQGFVTKEQALHLYDIHFEAQHNGHRIRGTLLNNADICVYVTQNNSCTVKRNNIKTAKRRFIEFKLPVPSTPSSVQKMVGCEWYLCFERDRVLTLKHHTLIQRSDYLIAEMKGDTHFQLGPNGLTTLTAKCNNI